MTGASLLVRRILPALAMLTVLAAEVRAQAPPDAVSPGALVMYSTIYSIGLEWDILNDSDHDATASVEYRAAAAAAWNSVSPLVRVDDNGRNMLAGSVLFLAPDTQYDVRVSLSDPDGGGETLTVTVRTQRLPTAPAGGRVFYVMPGAGGGDGSQAAPFGGIDAAQAVAQPGDTFLLHAGNYGGRIRFATPGTAASYIAWKPVGDGEIAMDGIEIAAGHIWLEGLTIRNQIYATFSSNAPTDVVLTRCSFLNNHYSIFLSGGGSGWYIADNIIVGNTPPDSGSVDSEGIELNTTNGHTVAHNSITRVADGISYPRLNVDIFGNDIFDTSDDGIELDFGLANVRVWNNRIHNAVHNAISFQPQSSGPWYIIRNQIVGSIEAAFKFRTTDRFALLHNTIVHWGTAWPGTSMMCCNEDHLLRAYARNNLWISVQGGQIWGFDAFTRDWRTDLDYDGFDWGTAMDPFTYEGWTFPDVWSFANASGLETHGIRVAKEACFEDFQVPGPSPTPVPPHVMTLRQGCNAMDAGAVLPGINDGFFGAAPDIGAHEYGHPSARYGPRPPLIVPVAPSDLTANALSSTRIDLRWTDNSVNEAGFRIERSLDGQTFTTIASVGPDIVGHSDTTVSAATHYFFRVFAFNDAGASPTSNVASATTPANAGPFGGTPAAIPGLVEAENFDLGGPSVAYHDTTSGNRGGTYRQTDVDIESTSDAGGGFNVGWTRPGEWLQYTVNVTAGGQYDVMLRLASTGSGGVLHLEVDGVDATGAIQVPNTGGWQTWSTVTVRQVPLGAGTRRLRLVFDVNGSTGGVTNVNRLELIRSSGTYPYGGTPIALPGTIEAENFDEGAASLAYVDTSAGNRGGAYRQTDVDIESTTDAGGGYNVGWTRPGEWLQYTVNVTADGDYDVMFRLASTGSGGVLHLDVEGVNATGAIPVPNTGGWQAWTTVTVHHVPLRAGVRTLRLAFDANGSTGGVANVNRLEIKRGTGSTPYGGTAVVLPGTIEAENFDEGGTSVAYFDTTAGNRGGAYRTSDVDIEATLDSGGGWNIGWARAGEWLQYSADVSTAGTYALELRVASASAGGTLRVEIDGVDLTGTIAVPNTGGWQVWQTIRMDGLVLQAGRRHVRLVFAQAGTNGIANVNWLRFAR